MQFLELGMDMWGPAVPVWRLQGINHIAKARPGQLSQSKRRGPAISYYFWGCTRKTGDQGIPSCHMTRCMKPKERRKSSGSAEDDGVTGMAHIYPSWVTAWYGTWSIRFCGECAEIMVTMDLTSSCRRQWQLHFKKVFRQCQSYSITAKANGIEEQKWKSCEMCGLEHDLKFRMLLGLPWTAPALLVLPLQRVKFCGQPQICPQAQHQGCPCVTVAHRH